MQPNFLIVMVDFGDFGAVLGFVGGGWHPD